jgi:hypothetical protein
MEIESPAYSPALALMPVLGNAGNGHLFSLLSRESNQQVAISVASE